MIKKLGLSILFIVYALMCSCQSVKEHRLDQEFSNTVDSLNDIDDLKGLELYLNSDQIKEISRKNLQINLKRHAELGYLYALEEAYHKSLDYYKEAIDLASGLQAVDSSITIDLYYYGAFVSDELGDTERSIGYLKHLVRLTSNGDMIEDNALALNGLANIYLKKSDYDNALFYQKQALELYQSLMIPADLARALDDLSLILYFKTAYKEAERYSNMALELLPNLDLNLQISVLNNASLIKIKLGESSIAIQYLEKAFKLLKHSDNKYFKGITEFNYGFGWMNMEDNEAALRYLDKAITTLQQLPNTQNLLLGKAYYYKGLLHLKSGLFDKAHSALKLGISYLLPESSAVEDTYEVLPFSYSDRDLVRCYHQMALIMALDTINGHSIRKILHHYDLCVDRLKLIRRNFESEASRLFLIQEAKVIYDDAIEFCFQKYNETGDSLFISKAHYYIECAQSPLLLRNNKQHQNKVGGIPLALVQAQRAAQLDIAYFQKQINRLQLTNDTSSYQINRMYLLQAKLKSDSINSIISQGYPKYFSEIYSSSIVDLERLQNILEAEEMIVQYYEGRDHIYRFDISYNEIRFVKLNDVMDLRHNVRLMIECLKKPTSDQKDLQHFISLGVDLYKDLLPEAKGFKRLSIVPSGILYQLPFDVLLTGLSTANQYVDLPYLINDVAINYQSSSTIFHKLYESKKLKPPTILAIAPYTKSSNEPKDLIIPNTADEVQNVLDLFSGEILSDDKAIKSKVLSNLDQHSIVHFATHGYSDTSDFTNAKLLLSCVKNPTDNCALYTYEIQNSSFTNSLVVLSACESGSGKINLGEGTMSMAKAFLYGGVPSVVMTRWQVNDRSSTILMSSFYEHLKAGFQKDEALRLAKQAYLDKHADNITAHPYYWSSFTQIGATTAYTTSNGFQIKIIALLLMLSALFVFFKLKRN